MTFRAPGRVNLIGEHTDYNLGFVLPVALQLAIDVSIEPAPDAKLRIHSESRNETCEWDIADIESLQPTGHWSDYPIGVAQQLIRAGFEIAPANLMIRSTVPEGAGLSSSAALEVSTALALLNRRPLPALDLARLCLRAEQDFVGLPCGIMDQYVSVFGRERSAIEIDCRSLDHRVVPLPDGITFIAVNTMVKHGLAGSAYQDRVSECASAAAKIGVASLRDASLADLQGLPDVELRRARHVISENQRVAQFVSASAAGDLEAMGHFLVESHRSLRSDYDVSCAELDFLVDAALKINGVYGARMTGGGFGGCAVAMLRSDAARSFTEDIALAYERAYHIRPEVYVCESSAGAGEVSRP